jgi:endoglucanase
MRRMFSVLVVIGVIAGLAGLQAQGAPAAPTPPSAHVRVNQVGYVSSVAKRAYLMASAAESGATFSVVNSSGTTVYSAPIGANLGSWSSAFPNVYALDFGAVVAAGTYTIRVSGPIAATSPVFRIDSGAAVYAGALTNTRSFYEVQRDGPQFVPSALRAAPAHLNDQTAMTYLTPNANSSGRFSGDLTPLGVQRNGSGGWWDAGDYLKFVQTASYTDAILLFGVRDFPAQMGAGSATSNFTAEVRFGTDWLQRMWDDSTRTLYYQVGIGSGNSRITGDHDIWRLPQADDTFGGTDPRYRYIRNRPVFRAGPPGSLISPNLAGRMAASLALCYQVFKATDPAYANQCLLAAEHIFELANTAPSGNLLTVIPFSFYPESEWRDDLELGATELYKALAMGGLPPGLPRTDPLYYLGQAAHWANAYMTGPGHAADSLNLYDVSALAHYDLHRSIGQAGNPPGLETSQAALLADIGVQLDNAVVQAATEPFGFGFPWATWDTTSHGAGQVVRPARRHPYLRRPRGPLAGQHPRRQRVGDIADHRKRHDVPALPAAPGGQHRRIARRICAGAGRRGGRRPELGHLPRLAVRDAGLPAERGRYVPHIHRPAGDLQGRRRVFLDDRAGDRPHRLVRAGVRLADEWLTPVWFEQ